MNWKKLILSLMKLGYTQSAIAKEARVTQSTIAALASGEQRDMRWSSGNRLISFGRRLGVAVNDFQPETLQDNSNLNNQGE